MKKRFSLTGGKEFPDHELLEMLLFYLIPRANTNGMAHLLLQKTGGMAGLLNADEITLQRAIAETKGCPKELPSMLALISQFEQVYTTDKCNATIGRTNINSSQSVRRYALDLCENQSEEQTWLLCIDSRMSVKNCLVLSNPRLQSENLFAEAFRHANQQNARGLIFVINHLDSDPSFTSSELAIAQRLSKQFSPTGVRLFDIILCCDGLASKLCSTGLLY